jgi:hypothetical protein
MNDKCGTPAGVAQHYREGTPTCADCRKARADYMRARRQRNPEIYRREKARDLAMARALWRLARIYPREFAALVDQEVAADKRRQEAS